MLGVVGDHDPAADQRLQRGALVPALGAVAQELGLRPAGPGALGGDQPEQDPARRVLLVGVEPREQPVGVAGQRAGDPAERGQRLGPDRPRVDVAGVPDLGERELQERQPARRELGLLDQRVDQRVGFERDALGRGRPHDHLADPLAGQRPQEVQPARHLVAEPGQHRQPRQEVGPAGRQHADRRHPHRERRQHRGDHAGLVGLGQRQQLLELVDEQQQPARRAVGRQRALADRAGERVGRVAQQRAERRLVGVEPAGERGGERVHRVAARDHVDPRPAVVIDQPRQHARPGTATTCRCPSRRRPPRTDRCAPGGPARGSRCAGRRTAPRAPTRTRRARGTGCRRARRARRAAPRTPPARPPARRPR